MPKRDPAHMQAQRVRILRAAFECIAENGIEGASIANICRRSGLSAGAIYIHFRNKEEILAETIRYAAAQPPEQAASWPALKAEIVDFSDLRGFDLVTVVRARLHLNAAVVRLGRLHDTTLPMLQASLAALAENLRRLQQAGLIRLRVEPEQTAINMSAYIDGMLWIGLAHRRAIAELESQVRDGLDSFVEILPAAPTRPGAPPPGPAGARRPRPGKKILRHP